MRSSSLFRILFILYCIEAGTFLVLAPWSPVWDRMLIQVSSQALRAFGLYPFVRAAVTGFGLVHLVWGAHDLDDLICQLLEKKTEHRPLDAKTVADALETIQDKVETQRSAGVDVAKKRVVDRGGEVRKPKDEEDREGPVDREDRRWNKTRYTPTAEARAGA